LLLQMLQLLRKMMVHSRHHWGRVVPMKTMAEFIACWTQQRRDHLGVSSTFFAGRE
jgi:hypothetical protein